MSENRMPDVRAGTILDIAMIQGGRVSHVFPHIQGVDNALVAGVAAEDGYFGQDILVKVSQGAMDDYFSAILLDLEEFDEVD